MNQGQLNELTTRLDKLIERTEPMKDEMYIALRSYLEEHSSMLRQILEELKGQKSESGTVFYPKATLHTTMPEPVKVPPEAVGPVTVETIETVEPKQPSKPGAKPNVNWNS